MFINPDCETKEELEGLLARGEKVEVFRLDQAEVPKRGCVRIEGPRNSESRWSATGFMEEGLLVLVA